MSEPTKKPTDLSAILGADFDKLLSRPARRPTTGPVTNGAMEIGQPVDNSPSEIPTIKMEVAAPVVGETAIPSERTMELDISAAIEELPDQDENTASNLSQEQAAALMPDLSALIDNETILDSAPTIREQIDVNSMIHRSATIRDEQIPDISVPEDEDNDGDIPYEEKTVLDIRAPLLLQPMEEESTAESDLPEETTPAETGSGITATGLDDIVLDQLEDIPQTDESDAAITLKTDAVALDDNNDSDQDLLIDGDNETDDNSSLPVTSNIQDDSNSADMATDAADESAINPDESEVEITTDDDDADTAQDASAVDTNSAEVATATGDTATASESASANPTMEITINTIAAAVNAEEAAQADSAENQKAAANVSGAAYQSESTKTSIVNRPQIMPLITKNSLGGNKNNTLILTILLGISCLGWCLTHVIEGRENEQLRQNLASLATPRDFTGCTKIALDDTRSACKYRSEMQLIHCLEGCAYNKYAETCTGTCRALAEKCSQTCPEDPPPPPAPVCICPSNNAAAAEINDNEAKDELQESEEKAITQEEARETKEVKETKTAPKTPAKVTKPATKSNKGKASKPAPKQNKKPAKRK